MKVSEATAEHEWSHRVVSRVLAPRCLAGLEPFVRPTAADMPARFPDGALVDDGVVRRSGNGRGLAHLPVTTTGS